MKKFLSIILAVLLVMSIIPLGLFSITASAEEYTEYYYRYTVSNNKATIVDVNTSISGKIVIPTTLGNYTVTSIGGEAFRNCDELTGITIPDSVISIGANAFSGCSNITSITISNAVTKIGDYAFSNCFSLKNLIIPDSVMNIGVGAFMFCNNLMDITIGKNVTSIGSNAFSSCDNLEGVYISDLAKWCKISFGNASSNPLDKARRLYLNNNVVSDLVIPDNITRIASFAFYNCDTLNSVTIGENVTQVGSSAFNFCDNLTSVTISNSVTNIGSYAFSNTNLTSVTIPNSITNIGSYAFSNTNLTSIIIPNSITNISSYAFASCHNLRSITIPKSVKNIENNAFGWCDNLAYVYYAGESRTGINIYSSNLELYNAAWYYNACIGTVIHVYDDNCDTECNVCVELRTAPHCFDNACDTECNVCDYIRTAPHDYEWIIDKQETCGVNGEKHEECIGCHVIRNENTVIGATGNHNFDNACNTECNVCDYIRTAPHDYEWIIDKQETCAANGIQHEECTVCHTRRNENTTIEATGNHTYDNTCDGECNVCDHVRSITHTYDAACDAQCNICGEIRTPDVHKISLFSIANSTSYPFNLSNGVYSSTNKANGSSSTFTITALGACTVQIEYYTSTESGYDKLIIKHNSATKVTKSGSTSWESVSIDLSAGDVVYITYSKDGSQSSGNDAIYFKFNSSELVAVDSLDWSCEEEVICDICGEVAKAATEHSYDNDCDAQCNVCGETRVPSDHVYDNNCDTQCNVCDYIRTITHDYEWVIDKSETCGETGTKHEECTVCHVTRNENTVIQATGDHTYDNTCDTTCNVCSFIRVIVHTYTNECDRDCNVCEEFRRAPHKYDNDCDDTCNLCGSEREVGDHKYTNACDAYCDSCSFERVPAQHIYDNACDAFCNVCELERTVPAHIYDNACDAFCNVCEAERDVPEHEYSSDCDTRCNICEKLRTALAAHTYANDCDADCNLCYEIRIPSEHKFTNFCDTDCNICGYLRTIEHTFTNECDNECNICFETRIAPHLYENNCDFDCNICKKTRVPSEHRYNNSCDIDCNECGDIRVIEHTYSGDDDLSCNVCYESLIPLAPTVENRGAESITLVIVEGCEYSIDGVNWQSSNIFNGLNPETEYTFYQRVKESETSKQSGSSEPLNTKTLKGYTITFCYNDGTNSDFTKIKTQGVGLSLGSVSKSGYTFLGWALTPNGTTFISSYTEDKNATFYAKWAYKCSICSGKGQTSTIVQQYATCNDCNGKGEISKKDTTNLRCLDCGSKNTKTENIPLTNGGYGWKHYCGSCYSENIGKGYIDVTKCTNCSGLGQKLQNVTKWVTCNSCNGKGTHMAPQPKAPIPVIKSQGNDFIELEAVSGAEYSIDGVFWQLTPMFNALPTGVYFVYQRYAASSINTVGEASEPLIIEIPEHSYDKQVATDTYLKSAATCTSAAVYYKSCQCGAKGTETFENGEALGHNYAAATCKAPKTCKVCSATTGSKLSHKSDGGTVTKKATCTATGTKTYKCALCKATIKTDTIAKVAHKYDSGKVTKKATCKATGVKTYTCSVCKGTKTETIAKLTTHTYSNNCDKSCNVCDKTRTVGAHKYSNSCDTTCNYCNAKRTIKHTYNNSCDNTCNVCKATRTITHSYKTTTTKATLSKNGSIVKKCTVCGKVASNSTIKYVKSFKLSTTTYTYNGKVKTPSVTVKDSAGKTLKKNTDYTVTYASGRKNAGTYKVTIKMIGKYSGTKTLTFKIKPAKLSSFKLSDTSYTYNGKTKTPSVTVKNANGTKMTKNKHYTVTYSSGRKNVGTYEVTIKGKGNYTGTKTLTFKINPAKTKVSKLTTGKKKITVAITKKSTQVTGYQIQYSTSKKFTNAKTKTISSYKTTKYTLKSLSARKTYYVRVRTYKTVGKTKYYSGWSTYKYVKTK